MSNTVIKIKRTSVAGRAANSTTLTNPGELALNMTDRIMYSTNGSVVFEIGANNTNVNVSNTLTVKSISANGSNGTAGHVLHSNGTATYWAADDQGVTSVATGNGLTGGTITTTGTVSVLANTGIIANATGLYVNAAYINTISSNSATYANASITNTFTVGTGTYFVANGNVGIGISSPGYRLDVRDAANTTIHVMGNTSGVRGGVSVDTPVAGAGYVGTFSNHPLTLGTNNAERMRIDTSGKVGIGTSNPGHTIHASESSASINVQDTSGTGAYITLTRGTGAFPASGAAAFSQFNGSLFIKNLDTGPTIFTTTSSDTERMRITNDGNVGIGNTSPDAKLAVTGTANISGNVVIGGSLNAANVTASLFTGNVTGTASNATNLNSQPASYYTNATNLSTGTVPTARLGSGTASATTFLAGDQSYKTAVTSVATGNGLTGGTITGTGTISVIANNGLSANATGVYVVPGNGLIASNSTGVHVGQGTGVTVNSTTVAVNASYIATISANNASFLGGTAAASYQLNSTLAANVATLTANAAATPTFSGDAVNIADITTRTESGFYQYSLANTTLGWPINTNSWQHLLSVTHNNDGNYYAMQLAASFFDQNWYLRNTNGVGTTAWSLIQTNNNLAANVATLAANSATYANASITNTFTIGTGTYFVANGNVGIGNTTPFYKLDVAGTIRGQATAATGDVLIIGNDSKLVDIDIAHTAGLYSVTNPLIGSLKLGSNGAIISGSDGNIGIANTTPAHKLRVQGDISLSGGIHANGSLGTTGQILTSNGTVSYWATPSGGGATLTANNTDTQTFYLPMANTTSGSWSNAVVSTTKLYFVPSTGTLNATIFNSLSDVSLKKDVENISSALELVAQMRGVKFTWKDSETRSSGIIAQELESVTPDLVNTNNDGIKSVNYDGIIAYLIEAVKEIKERLDTLNK